MKSCFTKSSETTMQVLKAIENYIRGQLPKHNGPDLLKRVLKHVHDLELQVNVAAGNGFPVNGKKSTYTDGLDEWWNIRVPKKANDVPEFKDYDLQWPFDEHVDLIGCTGWDWRNRRSLWVGFDFDAITGHAAGIGVSADALEAVKQAACALDYVEVRASTGGNGFHLYVLFDENDAPPCENHTIHAALGRAVLGMMASAVNFDFASHVDACGGNMWILGRKANGLNLGLRLIKEAGRTLKISDLPENWRDHVDVVNRKRSKVRVNEVVPGTEDSFDYLASSRKIVPLDDKHNAIIALIRKSGYSAMWSSDHHLLQTHTKALEKVLDEHRDNLDLHGFFKTIAQGKDPGTPNCFLFPLENGAFKVYKFSPGNVEAETWEQDGKGWTTCYFNRAPSLKVAAKAMGGIEDAEKGGFVFKDPTKAVEAVKALGQELKLPNMPGRETRLKSHKDGRLIVQVKKAEGDEGMASSGWLAKKDYWVQVFETRTDNKFQDVSINEYDGIIRCLVSPSGERAGWTTKDKESDKWSRGPKDDAKHRLLSERFSKTEVDFILGLAISQPWKQVNRPFESIYPGDRQWNHGAAQYRFKPAEVNDEDDCAHPTWDAILQHCGADLNEALRDLQWAQKANIRTGAQYLLTWIACMMREPHAKLPYLFLYGDQNNGKSSLHKAISMLLNGGVVAADKALTSEFNGELANCVLATIEETDLSTSKTAYNKIKDLTTNDEMWVRRMRTDLYRIANTLHFIQTANEQGYCPIAFGDTRVVVIYVQTLDVGSLIPPAVLRARLEAEAPHFMRTLMDLQLPPVIDRMRLPVVMSSTKERAENLARNPLDEFLSEVCHEVKGSLVLLKDFRIKFEAWLEENYPGERNDWSHIKKITGLLPHRFPYGAGTGNNRFIANISFTSDAPKPNAPVYHVKNGRLVIKKD